MAPPKRKTTNPGASDAEDLNLHEVPIGQSPPIEPTPTQLAEKEKRIQAEHTIEAKKAAAAGKKAAAASAAAKEAAAAATRTTTIKAETLNNLSQHEDDQLEQNLHDELNLELQALEKKKTHLANQLATRKRAAEQAQKLAEAKHRVAEMQAEIQKMQEEVGQLQESQSTHAAAETSKHHEGQDLRQTNHIHQDKQFQQTLRSTQHRCCQSSCNAHPGHTATNQSNCQSTTDQSTPHSS